MQRHTSFSVFRSSIQRSLSRVSLPVFLLSALAGLLCIGAGPAARAQTESVTYLHTFLSSYFQNTDGDGPFGNLIQGADGSLYGTTAYGGTYGAGTVYKITPDGTFTLLHAFDGSDGGFSEPDPYPSYDAGLTQTPDGSLYGTTMCGGANGRGTIYKMTPDGSMTILHSFATPSSYGGDVFNADGAYPGKLSLASDGNFYGTTIMGGSYGLGTLYEITPDGAFTSLYFFGDVNGAMPVGGLTEGTDGYLYGTTAGSVAGVGAAGTVFRLNVQLSIPPSHVLFQDVASGQMAFWQMDGAQVLSANPIAAGQDPAWQAVGEADFNGDGWPDILFQNATTGQLAVWFMDVTLATNGEMIGLTPPPGWQAVSLADFNADGSPDILFQNTSSGQLAIWLMNGTTPTNGLLLTPAPPPGWNVVGTSDFNGDGQPDILFQNASTGQLAVWFMSGTSVLGGAYITPVQDPSWKAVAVKDLNRDGSADIVFQNTTGQMVYWLMNGTTAMTGSYFGVTPPDGWKVVASH